MSCVWVQPKELCGHCQGRSAEESYVLILPSNVFRMTAKCDSPSEMCELEYLPHDNLGKYILLPTIYCWRNQSTERCGNWSRLPTRRQIDAILKPKVYNITDWCWTLHAIVDARIGMESLVSFCIITTGSVFSCLVLAAPSKQFSLFHKHILRLV
jgi:hypothetical protein